MIVSVPVNPAGSGYVNVSHDGDSETWSNILEAHANAGYEFVEYVYTIEFQTPFDPTRIETFHNQAPKLTIQEDDVEIPAYGHWKTTVLSIVAIFRSLKVKLTVRTFVSPDDAANDGCTSSPEEAEYEGLEGETVRVQLSASENGDWSFSSWKRNGSVESRSKTYSFQYTFGSSSESRIYYANFVKHTGLILRSGSSGIILRGRGGSILHDS